VVEIIARIIRRESGQTVVEYALIIALISLLAIAGLTLIAGPNPDIFSRIGSAIGDHSP
jgi:Flp pilus assembly pilin Flp